ncbi:uncharacterized protein K460DRAFT_397544 [Cucurbitaria berberidis CBS 394.84]|uniref:Uncharacterized protein n=1 Tax=Cucurbitaria berberidis CBS 394.84 TaxID=1168544 RepID=A0A9P4GFE8_9PLEO|nr:uncharacterized protein K460DRAFT_397544 [Cucurbitaria berberidis CBS 394.84]KAF1844454.1 hypothetical protein K460DRAFT_397544 [Cucurbitaria berberidis CBS 394.84]
MTPPLSIDRSSELTGLLNALGLAPNRPDIAAIPAKEKKTPSDILRIISSAESGGNKEQRLRIVFCAELWDLCHSSTACTAILQKPGLKSLSDVSLFVFSSASKDRGLALMASDVQPFEEALFEKQPAAVLLALHRRDELCIKPDTKAKVLDILERAVAAGANLVKESLLDFVANDPSHDGQNAADSGVLFEDIKSLQRLIPVVKNPRTIGCLLKASLTSAHTIAARNRGDFLDMMEKAGFSSTVAADIHSRASVIDLRNEDLWSEFLRSRSQVPLLSVEGQIDVSKDSSAPNEAVPINLTTLFNEMDSVEYDETNSVLSPAAYLVDLLQLLKKSQVTDEKTLLNLFEDRRPDIAHLHLSRANTTKLVSYNGLANEVMEAFIREGKGDSTATANTLNEIDDTDDSAQLALPNAGGIFVSPIGKQAYPVSAFPYNNAVFSTRELLHTAGVSRLELLNLFRSDATLSRNAFGSSDSPRLLHAASVANDRKWAAEALGLQHCDWIAITKEGFYDLDFVRSSNSTALPADQNAYISYIGGHSTASYWGYAPVDETNTAEKQMTDAASSKGLSNIRDELLPRSGLSFKELIRILDTKFVGRRLAILPEFQGKYSERLGDFTLLETSRVNSGSATVPLSEETCHTLQAFIRLWKRSGWDINEIDEALVLFARPNCVDGEEAARMNVDCQTLESLAQVKTLSTLVSLEINKLLPFWGLENEQVQAVLFERLFVKSRLVTQYPRVLFSGLEATRATISEVSAALKLALNVNDEGLADFVSAADLQFNDVWTSANMTKLYRVWLLLKMTAIPTAYIRAWLDIFSRDRALFENPLNTLTALQTWHSLSASTLPVKSLIKLAAPPKDVEESLTYPFLRSVLGKSTDIKSKYAGLFADRASQTVESLSDFILAMSTDLFAPGAPAEILELVKGTIVTPCKASLPDDAEIPASLSTKLTYEKSTGSLYLYGVLNPSDEVALRGIWKSGNGQTAAVTDALKSQRRPFNLLPSRMFSNATKPAAYLWDSTLFLKEKSRRDEAILERCYDFALRLHSVWLQKALNEAVESSLANTFAHIPSKSLPTLSESITMQPDKSSPAVQGISSISQFIQLADEKGFGSSAYFLPPTTGSYTFTPPAGHSMTVNIDHKEVVFGDSAADTASKGLQLSSDKLCRISIDKAGSLGAATWFSGASPVAKFSSANAFPLSSVPFFNSFLGQLQVASSLVETHGLEASQIDTLTHHNLSLTRPALADLQALQVFTACRSIVEAKQLPVLSKLYDWAKDTLQAYDWAQESAAKKFIAEISKQIASALLWPEAKVTEYLEAISDPTYLKTLSSLRTLSEELARMKAVFDLANRFGFGVAAWFSWANAFVDSAANEDVDLFSHLRSCSLVFQEKNLRILVIDTIRKKKQDVLTSYLLAQTDFKKLEIRSEYGLFEHFLIDVQMGSQMETTRIRQAISTVQLFIQRCLLGMEKKNGIKKTIISKEIWAWMSRYALWQANRKVFLYPENWADPTLRDDKTEPFQQLEARVLQTSLNEETIGQILRDYIYAVDDVADLEVESYLWEASRGFHARIHFFSRTRTAPYVFYYRKLEIGGVRASDARWDWYPWTKMEVDIPLHEVNANGVAVNRPGTYLLPALYRGRVFLFIPQFLKKSSPPPATIQSPKALVNSDTSVSPPTEMWEIKMAWTENKNGKWGSKQVTSTGIKVLASAPGALPPIAQFRFRLKPRFQPPTTSSGSSTSLDPRLREILVIDVEQSYELATTKTVYKVCGQFELQGSRVLVRHEVGTTETETSKTSFSKLESKTQAVTLDDLKAAVSQISMSPTQPNEPLLLAVPPGSDQVSNAGEQKLVWPIVLDESQYPGAAGLVVERTTSTDVQTYFGFPSIDLKTGAFNLKEKITTDTQVLTHGISHALVERASTTEDLAPIFRVLENVKHPLQINAFGQDGNTFHELARPYALYNWELGFHAVALLMERLLATQQHELALNVARMVFDPTRDEEGSDTLTASDKTAISHLDRCWRFLPFRSPIVRQKGSAKTILQSLGAGTGVSADIDNWRSHPFAPHIVARGRPAVYMKRFIAKYIEILIASGDVYFRQNSMDTITLALQRYIEASEVFGPAPQTIMRPTTKVTKTYYDLKNLLNDFSTANVDMELQFPFFVATAGNKMPNESEKELLGFARSTFFAVPPNPELAALRATIDDRLYKLRNGLDINGNVRRMPLFDPPIDPGQLVNAAAGSGGFAGFLEIAGGPMPNYRAAYLLGKAMDLAGEIKSLGDALLSVKEKRDGEHLSNLKARQEVAIQAVLMDIKVAQREEALKSIEVLKDSRQTALMRLRYYLRLVGEESKVDQINKAEWDDIEQAIPEPTKDELRMSPQEKLEMDKTDAANRLTELATALENGCSALAVLPELTTEVSPMGVGVATKFDATNIIRGIMFTAEVMKAGAQKSSNEAGSASRKATLIRQLQDRRLQANNTGREIKNIDKQLEAQQKRIAVCDAEIKMQTQQTANLVEAEEFLKTKFTNEALYAWIEGVTRKLFHQTYLIALEVARAAETAYAFEYGPKYQRSLTGAHWDEARDGLLSGHSLGLELRRIEHNLLNRDAHDHELTKNISLRQIAPWALLRLRESGATEFSLPEVLFDMDFPGHYGRRIKSVSLSIPCILGPYTTPSCSLTLLQHQYRIKSGKSSSGDYYDIDITGDERFHTDRVPVTSLAISSAMQDSGRFELSFKDERYIPFEGAGVIGRWHIELPSPVRQFDYNTISDVVMHVRYTALEGGGAWRKTAQEAVLDFHAKLQVQSESGLLSLLDLKADFPNEWYNAFKTSTKKESGPAKFTLAQMPSRLPYWTANKTITARKLWMVLEAADAVEPYAPTNPVQIKFAGIETPIKFVPASETVGKLLVLQNETPQGQPEFSVTLADCEVTFPKAASYKRAWLLVQYTVA